jgi:hypothetical protein
MVQRLLANDLMRARLAYLLAAAVLIPAGLATRRYRDWLPAFVGEYGGDVLWAALVFYLASAVLAGRPLMRRALTALLVAAAVEFSQLYHAAWIDRLRRTTLGGLVLGFGFLWTDLVCYAVGVALAALAEWGLRRRLRSTPAPPSRTLVD